MVVMYNAHAFIYTATDILVLPWIV